MDIDFASMEMFIQFNINKHTNAYSIGMDEALPPPMPIPGYAPTEYVHDGGPSGQARDMTARERVSFDNGSEFYEFAAEDSLAVAGDQAVGAQVSKSERAPTLKELWVD